MFIVHGHDDVAKLDAARFVERLGFEAVILHEQPNRGRTIIEKFEGSSTVEFAFVLLTPDDVGGPNGGEATCRARQNMIFELDFFFGALGRQRVCALVRGEIEKPSDVQGVVYVNMDAGRAWKFDVAKEMQAAGMPVDLNRLLKIQ